MAFRHCPLSLLTLLLLECLFILVCSFQNRPNAIIRSTPSVSAVGARPPSHGLYTLPKLIVFDLDNTLWSPELYQLRNHQRTKTVPVAGKDVKLLEGAQAALALKPDLPDTQFAVASRTKSVEWAHALLKQFDIDHLFDYIEFFPGHKRTHLENIQRNSGIQFCEMLFFDDARHGKYGNCEPVSQMGVLAVHCPSGLHTPDVFHTGLERYKEWDKTPNTIVEWDGSMTTCGVVSNSDERIQGEVKMVNEKKGFGFIQPDNGGNDVFFHFSNLPSSYAIVNQGDKLSFAIERDDKTGKTRAQSIQVESANEHNKNEHGNQIKMHCFSMNQPFAALLANGYKTLETRNGTMFTTYPEGTQMLLHVGRRTYPDRNRHLDIMKSGGLNEDEIEQLKSLPPGFGKGMAVAILEIGKTYETTVQERSDAEFQRNVAAYGKDSGRMVTEIKRVAYLKKPVRVSGQGGVFKVEVDRNMLPEGWELSRDKVPGKTNMGSNKKQSTGKGDGISNASLQKGGGKPIYSISG